jgi:hypothetical protein
VTVTNNLDRKTRRTLVLVSLNFAMLLVLFCGLGFVLWQSSTLLNALGADLARAERAVAEVRERLQRMSPPTLGEAVAERLGERIGESIREALDDTKISESLERLAVAVDDARASLADTRASLRDSNARLRELDTDALARRVAGHVAEELRAGTAAPAAGG